jgi:hypothetical protein
MSDEKKTDKPEETTPSTSSSSFSFGDLRNLIKEEVHNVFSSEKTTADSKTAEPTTPPAPTNLSEEVRREVEKIRSAEEKAADEQSVRDRLSKVEQTVAEKPPTEVRRITRRMWGSE